MGGAAVLVGAVIAYVESLVAMAKSSTLAGPLAVVAWYHIAAGAALAAGASLGACWRLARYRGLNAAVVLAHAQLNLLGRLGLAIIGTQFTLWPMVLRTRMSEDAPGTACRVLVITVCGPAVTTTAPLVTPYLGGADWLAAAGTACYLAGAVRSLVPAIREMRARPPRTAAAWALLAGNAWLLAALIADVAWLTAGLGHRHDLTRTTPFRQGTCRASDSRHDGPRRTPGGIHDGNQRAAAPAAVS